MNPILTTCTPPISLRRTSGLSLTFMLPVLLSGWLLAAAPAQAQVSVGVSLPGLQIGINVPVYPRLVRVPGYPVYYDAQANNNYFFYDGLYWVFRDDTWYQSSWYNGPWRLTQPAYVPLYVLRVPVRYYRQPPGFFRGWRADAAPRWGEHFGRDWQHDHKDWDRWDRRKAPPAAPLPTYQRHYDGEHYPQAPERQQAVRDQHYKYKGHDGRDDERDEGRGNGRDDERGNGKGGDKGKGTGNGKGEHPGRDRH